MHRPVVHISVFVVKPAVLPHVGREFVDWSKLLHVPIRPVLTRSEVLTVPGVRPRYLILLRARAKTDPLQQMPRDLVIPIGLHYASG